MSTTVIELVPVHTISAPLSSTRSQALGFSTGSQLRAEPDDEDLPPYLEYTLQNTSVSESSATLIEVEYPSGIQFFFICLALVLVLTLGGLDGNIVATAAPSISDYFHTIADVGWYAAAYRLCSCALQFLFGRLYKIFSTKKVLLATIIIFLIGSIICAAATSSVMFVFGRAICGAGFAGINAGYLSVACQILPLRKRPVFNGVMAGIESISVISAPILGGVLTQHLSWRYCFWINLPVGAVAFLAIILALSEKKPSQGAENWKEVLRQLDLVGNLVLIPCLTCLFVALSWAGTRYPWSDARVIGLFVAFGLLLCIFSVDQYLCQERATLPPRILKNHNVIAGFIFSACTNGSESVLEYYMPTYFQAVRGASPAESGYLMLPILVGFLIALLLQGSGTTTTGYYTPFMILASVLMPIAAGLITTWEVDTGIVKILALAAFAGFSTGIGFQGPQSAVQTSLPDADASTGLAVILFAQGFGPAVFLSVAQSIFTNRLDANLHQLVPDLDVSFVQNVGISDLKDSVESDNLDKVILGFDQTFTQTWYLTVGTTCLTMIGSLLMDWRSVKEKRT